MQITFEPAPIFLMHVPKTAGTTLRLWIRPYYRRTQCIGIFQLNRKRINTARNRAFRYVYSAHYGFPVYKSIHRPDLAVITVLREPIERAVSEFYHHQRIMRRSERGDKHARLLDMLGGYSFSDGDINDHVTVPAVQQLLSNGQTRCLAGSNVISELPELSHSAWSPLPTASDWLETMQIVGITEKYRETVEMISDMLGIPLVGSGIVRNVNTERAPGQSYRTKLRPETVAVLEDLNRDDIELYRRGKELFEEQYARFRARPKRHYSLAAYGRTAFMRLGKHRKRRSHQGST